jgi:hypothetical protein
LSNSSTSSPIHPLIALTRCWRNARLASLFSRVCTGGSVTTIQRLMTSSIGPYSARRCAGSTSSSGRTRSEDSRGSPKAATTSS